MRHDLVLNTKLQYASERELDWLAEYGRTHPDATVVLIGAGPGVMALALLNAHTSIALHVIDNALSHTFKVHLEQAGCDMSRVRIYERDSGETGNAWDSQNVDLLIVDGDHSYNGVRRDLIAWWVHVKVDGLVFFHDYYRVGSEWEGIPLAVKEWLSERLYARVKSFDSTRIVQRIQ